MKRIAALAGLLLALAGLSGCTPMGVQARQCASAESGMVWVPAGSFVMGESPRYREEGPPRTVSVAGFWMDTHELTNDEFAEFVKRTGYRTVAERVARSPDGSLEAGSAIFAAPDARNASWWRWMPGAYWRHPSGPKSSIGGRGRDPVVQLAYEDVEAYARWAGKMLPSEAQWEYAARAGAPALSEPITKQGTPTANYYQGVFPARDLATDGFGGMAPVGCFPANAFGLYDMIGNVWEWTSSEASAPQGSESVRVIKGGSYLCASNYCGRYRAAARQFEESGLGTNHIGVRLIRVPPKANTDAMRGKSG